MYTPLETAVEELRNRRRRFAGRTPGRDWLPDDLPEHPSGYAFSSRYVATPNFETRRFLENTNGTGLLPVIAGLSRDKFVTHNPLKRALARMGFQRGYSRHGQALVEFVNILDDNQQGSPLGEVRTFWGQSLIAFHQELLAHALNGDRWFLTTRRNTPARAAVQPPITVISSSASAWPMVSCSRISCWTKRKWSSPEMWSYPLLKPLLPSLASSR